MKSLITEADQIQALATELGEATQKFYRATLKQLVGYKVFIARKIITHPLYGKYGENLIGRLVADSGLKETILYDSVKMYEIEQLTSAKEKKFLESFEEDYSSWNEYRQKKLGKGQKSTSGKSGCRNCPEHCPKS